MLSCMSFSNFVSESLANIQRSQLLELLDRRSAQILLAACSDAELKPKSKQEADRGKTSMKKLFGRPNIKKDGSEGKVGGCCC